MFARRQAVALLASALALASFSVADYDHHYGGSSLPFVEFWEYTVPPDGGDTDDEWDGDHMEDVVAQFNPALGELNLIEVSAYVSVMVTADVELTDFDPANEWQQGVVHSEGEIVIELPGIGSLGTMDWCGTDAISLDPQNDSGSASDDQIVDAEPSDYEPYIGTGFVEGLEIFTDFYGFSAIYNSYATNDLSMTGSSHALITGTVYVDYWYTPFNSREQKRIRQEITVNKAQNAQR